MPIYEYECSKCGRTKEILQHSQEPAEPQCRRCNIPMKRLISPSAFILKGSGWYVTDYPSKSRKEALDAEKKASEEKEKASSKKGKKTGASPHRSKSKSKKSKNAKES